MTMNNIKDRDNFLSELKCLLEKYDASIYFNVAGDSDTHSLYDECMNVYIGKERVLKVDGWNLNHDDIKVDSEGEL